MMKWHKLTKTIYIGLFPLAILLFLLQELPYLLLPALGTSISPLMDMPAQLPWLDFLEKFFGIASVITLIFLVRADRTTRKQFVLPAIVALILYYLGWGFYAHGYHKLWFYLVFLVAMPPIYYFFLGLWRRNVVTSVLAVPFLIIHLINFSINFLQQ